MTNQLRTTARIAGLLYLVIFVAGIFAEFVVRSSIIVSGDAAATTENLIASEGLFRAGIAGDLIMIMSDVAIALMFYVLLKPVSHPLALLAAFFRLAQATVLGLNLVNLFLALQLTSGDDFLAVFSQDQLDALSLAFLEMHGIGYSLGLIFFALSIAILGYLISRSSYIPRILGIMLIVAASGYLVDGFAKVLLTNYADYQEIFDTVVFTPAFVAELALALWLLIKGVKSQPVDTELALNAAQTDAIHA